MDCVIFLEIIIHSRLIYMSRFSMFFPTFLPLYSPLHTIDHSDNFVPLIISLQTCLIVFTNNFPCCLTILQLHCISYIQYKKSIVSSFIKISYLQVFLFNDISISLQYHSMKIIRTIHVI